MNSVEIVDAANVGGDDGFLIIKFVNDNGWEKFISIKKSDLGVNPQIDGQIVRIRIPDLTEERRKELIKVLKNMVEKSKISVRNIRRDGNEDVKKLLKDKKISEDDNKIFEKNIKKITDDKI